MSDDPASVVRRFIELIEARDVPAAAELLADDVHYDNVPLGAVDGRETAAAVLSSILDRCSRVEWPVQREAVTGTVVCNERLDRFEMPHGWVEVPVMGVWEVVDGKITLWRDYFDAATYRDQMPEERTDVGAP